MDEKSLLKRLQNRDEKVFEEIIDRYNAYVTTIVRSLLSSRGTNASLPKYTGEGVLWQAGEGQPKRTLKTEYQYGDIFLNRICHF